MAHRFFKVYWKTVIKGAHCYRKMRVVGSAYYEGVDLAFYLAEHFAVIDECFGVGRVFSCVAEAVGACIDVADGGYFLPYLQGAAHILSAHQSAAYKAEPYGIFFVGFKFTRFFVFFAGGRLAFCPCYRRNGQRKTRATYVSKKFPSGSHFFLRFFMLCVPNDDLY